MNLPCDTQGDSTTNCKPLGAIVLNNQVNIKDEFLSLKTENDVSIDVSHLLSKDLDADFDVELLPSIEKSESCEDMFVADIVHAGKLTPLTVNNKRKKKNKDMTDTLENNGEDIFATDCNEKLITVINKTRKKDLPQLIHKNNDVLDNIEKPKRKVKRLKKDTSKNKKDADEMEKVKEAIECEFCHKVLTSKLSLRNHYKIHTGFDVVCEVGIFFNLIYLTHRK